MNIKIETRYDAIRVYFNDTLHLHLKRSEILGVQSWRSDENNYSIEITLRGGVVTTEYDQRDKWEAILKGIEPFL